MKRGKYSEEEWKAITNADCTEVARALGYEFDEKRSDRNALRVKDQGGLFVWRNGSGWYCHSTGEKGHAVDLVRRTLGCEYREALDFIADNLLIQTTDHHYKEISRSSAAQKEPPKEFALPERAEKNNRVAAYLKYERGIPYKVINYAMESKILYQDKEYGNCCFVGYDNSGVPRYCTKRGTNSFQQFRGEVAGSDKSYSFKMMGSNTQGAKLYIFEAPIDAMSHAALNEIVGRDWSKDTRLAMGGCCYLPIERHLKDSPGRYSEIVICTDNDEAGIKMAKEIEEKYGGEYKVTRRSSFAKDWNEDLKNINGIAQSNKIPLKNALNVYYNKCIEQQKQEELMKNSEQNLSEGQSDDENCEFSDEIEP